jgi:hypothetical protein
MRILWILLSCFFIGGCSLITGNPDINIQPEPSITPGSGEPPIVTIYTPREEDSKLSRSLVYIDSSQLNIMESYPLQFSLRLVGSMPTPCHQLRIVISPADNKKRILIDAYSLFDPEMMCVEMLQKFDVTLPLGSFTSGHYSIWVNGSKISEFDS